ncbi:chondroitin synthase [Clostridium puniceum]|uniref:Chondroitin synthase n=1 Tax=Clostridium puniceum TaxID=29367 RepID=A0A1S8T025_9CLOT|nr:glycosyltransferase [Clostridium puniceum]OOM71137.1 chondroitin synthase [Clostridium puniceum]
MYKYRVSIIIPTFNRSNLLNLTLNSLLMQSLSINEFEVIIVDDGSTDDTVSVIDKFDGELNIKYFYQEDNGFRAATARNVGINNSEGEICVFIDSGILLASNAIDEQIKLHNLHSNSAIIGYVYGFDEYNENYEKLIKMNIDSFNVDKYFNKLEEDKILDLRESIYFDIGDDLTKWPAPWVIFFTAYVSVKKETLINIGMFDESFDTWGGEDIDLGINLYKNDTKIILSRKLRCIHYPHEKFKTKISPEEMEKHTLRKKEYLNQKHKLYSTEIFINSSSKELNKILLNK